MNSQNDGLELETRFSLQDSDVKDFVKLSLTQYQDKPITVASVVRWKHLENPCGSSIGIELKKHVETVGRIWLQRHEWKVLGKSVPVLFPQDLLVKPNERSIAVSLKLIRLGFETAERESGFFYHSSNPNSEPIYRRILRISQTSEMSCSMLPLEPIGLLRWFLYEATPGETRFRLPNRIWRVAQKIVLNVVGARRVNLIQEPTEWEQARIVASFTQRQSCTNSRTPEWRRWRYEGSGEMTYRVCWFADNRQPIGYVVVSQRELKGIPCLFIVDVVWAEPMNPRSARKVIRFLIDQEICRKCKVLVFLGNYQNYEIRKFAKGLPFRIPSGLLPQRLPIYMRLGMSEPVSDSLSNDELRQAFKSSYFTLADLDVI